MEGRGDKSRGQGELGEGETGQGSGFQSETKIDTAVKTAVGSAGYSPPVLLKKGNIRNLTQMS